MIDRNILKMKEEDGEKDSIERKKNKRKRIERRREFKICKLKKKEIKKI